ncbi:MAG: hypothetical protein OEY05_03015 [Paracoccaceae bacterium]|jgi:Flp pilus assembly pilin Flp|nr:hypothetical protein [Paracoccaceae bacterium]MDH5528984.1 hypothetical protein [Paracoccaceae bacterium]
MKMFRALKKFQDEEEGAVTADWVVLTAAVIGLGVAAFISVSNGVNSIVDKIAHHLGSHVHPT